MLSYKPQQKPGLKALKGAFVVNNRATYEGKSINLLYKALNSMDAKSNRLFGKRTKAALKVLSFLSLTGGNQHISEIAQQTRNNIPFANNIVTMLLNARLIGFSLVYDIKYINKQLKKVAIKRYSLSEEGNKLLREYINE